MVEGWLIFVMSMELAPCNSSQRYWRHDLIKNVNADQFIWELNNQYVKDHLETVWMWFYIITAFLNNNVQTKEILK